MERAKEFLNLTKKSSIGAFTQFVDYMGGSVNLF